MADPLEALAARAQDDPFFLASLLAAYARSERLDDAGLAAALGCPTGDLAMLRLCRAPRTEPREFSEDVARISERFGLDSQRLAEAVKRGRVLRRFEAPKPAQGGFLMAARDHEPPPDQPPEAP
ncbi:MAG TPA: hypothetical protein VKA46_26780 [Gemmataceae bacterium]|nr:hypothetical protein [Gemmataceae bacterium]